MVRREDVDDAWLARTEDYLRDHGYAVPAGGMTLPRAAVSPTTAAPPTEVAEHNLTLCTRSGKPSSRYHQEPETPPRFAFLVMSRLFWPPSDAFPTISRRQGRILQKHESTTLLTRAFGTGIQREQKGGLAVETKKINPWDWQD